MPHSFYDGRRMYRQLSKRYFSGKLSRADYHAEVRAIRVGDDQGQRWRIDSETGEWQRFDGGQWVYDNPDLSQRLAGMASRDDTPEYGEWTFPWEIAGAMAFVVVVMIAAAIVLYSILQVP